MARNPLSLTRYEAHAVLAPARGDEGRVVEALRVVVFAPHLPQRAIHPELLIGEDSAHSVFISPDQQTMRGLFFRPLPEAGAIRVRYGDSLEGELAERFTRRRIRPLPKDCETPR